MTVGDLMEHMTTEELLLWGGYLDLQASEAQEAQRKAARRR